MPFLKSYILLLFLLPLALAASPLPTGLSEDQQSRLQSLLWVQKQGVTADRVLALVVDWAEEENSYAVWRAANQHFAAIDPQALLYDALWQVVEKIDQKQVYQDFMAVRADSPEHHRFAVYRQYALAEKANTVKAYRAFMSEYPESIEALAALQRVQTIAFQHIQKHKNPELYDLFVKTFPDAPQVPAARQAAYELLSEDMQRRLQSGGQHFENYQILANELYNQGWLAENAAKQTSDPAEQAAQWLIAKRNYALLEQHFPGSNALSNYLQREENRAFHSANQAYQAAMLQAQAAHLETLYAIHQEVIAAKNEISGLRGDIQGLQGELQGIRSEVQGLRGDVQTQTAMQVQYLQAIDDNIRLHTTAVLQRMAERAALRQQTRSVVRGIGSAVATGSSVAANFAPAAARIPMRVIGQVVGRALVAMAHPVAEMLFP